MRHPRIAASAALLALPVALLAQATAASGAAGRAAADSMVVSTDWLAAHLNDPRVVVVDIVMENRGSADRIPGSRAMAYEKITVKRNGLSTELPELDSLRSLVESLGISNDSRVVVLSSHNAPMATRFLMTLDYLGHPMISYLDGGLTKWKAEHRPVSQADAAVTRGTFTPHPRTGIVVDADWIMARLGKPGLALIDTRTLGEYNGTGNRSGMPSAGHLADARQLEWEWLFRTDNEMQLKDRAELQKLYADRMKPGDTVVTYCWVGYRASATYFAARMLGLDAKFYDGSYQDWQQRKLPTVAGEKP